MNKKELENQIKESDNARKYAEAIRLFSSDGSGEDKEKAITLFLETAINGYVPSMDAMAYICHDNMGDLQTQDREQECFWFEQTVKNLKGNRLFYHAQNMIYGSYDKCFPNQEINEMLGIAAGFGSEQSVEALAAYYSKNLEDKESLKKSLYWFYSLNDPSPEIETRLTKVENVLGLR